MNTVEFTPTEEKTVRWSCWMGMIPGSFIVTDSGEATNEQVEEVTKQNIASGGSCGGSCGGSGRANDPG